MEVVRCCVLRDRNLDRCVIILRWDDVGLCSPLCALGWFGRYHHVVRRERRGAMMMKAGNAERRWSSERSMISAAEGEVLR